MRFRRLLIRILFGLILLPFLLVLYEHIHSRWGAAGSHFSVAGDDYHMTMLEQIIASGQAEMGDAEAAWSLNRMYAFAPGAASLRHKARYWLYKAASNGLVYAQQKLVLEISEAYPQYPVEAKQWMNRANVLRWANAAEVLSSMNAVERREATSLQLPKALTESQMQVRGVAR